MAVTQHDPASTVGQNVTFSATLFDSTLSHFVGYLPTSALDASLISASRGDFQDIRFYLQNDTELDREITTGGSIFVRIPSASSSVSTVLDVNSGSGVSKGNDVGVYTSSNFFTWYHCNEASGNLIDSVGNWDGVASGLTYGQTGKVEDAVYAETSDYVNMGNVTDIQSSTDLTICLWVKFSSLSTGVNRVLLASLDSTTDRLKFGQVSPGSSPFRIERGDGTNYGYKDYSMTSLFTVDTWHHVAIDFDGAGQDVTLYVDGAQKTPSSTTGTFPTGNNLSTAITLLNNNTSQSLAPAADIDEYSFNSSNLSANYIKALYNNQDDYSSYVTANNYTVFGNRVAPLLNPGMLGNGLLNSGRI